jgi:hypothetical protein
MWDFFFNFAADLEIEMCMKKHLVILLLLIPLAIQAQWRFGVNGGAAWNHYSMDKQYATDYRFEGRWGGTAGITAQYNFFDWLGLRAGAFFAQRNYRHTRGAYADRLDIRYVNNYLLFPVTVNFSFGGQQVRGFVNLGVYGGAWLTSNRSGQEYSSISSTGYEASEKVAFSDRRDQRGDFGYTGGLGIEYKFHPHWMAQIEAVCYYSVISVTKQYMEHQKDYRYHTTIGLQAGISYIF